MNPRWFSRQLLVREVSVTHLNRAFVCLGLQYVPYRVQARLRPRDELRGSQGPISEGAPREGAVDDLDLFTFGVEDQAVFPDDRPTA